MPLQLNYEPEPLAKYHYQQRLVHGKLGSGLSYDGTKGFVYDIGTEIDIYPQTLLFCLSVKQDKFRERQTMINSPREGLVRFKEVIEGTLLIANKARGRSPGNYTSLVNENLSTGWFDISTSITITVASVAVHTSAHVLGLADEEVETLEREILAKLNKMD